ncbi:MAG: hypothetical protein GYB68_00540 [Chloroflexi bacterium]|nr:hypothetical protein [Chloroflexota bacterium]
MKLTNLLMGILIMGALMFSPTDWVAANEVSTEPSYDSIEYLYDRFHLFADRVELRFEGDELQATAWQAEINLWNTLGHDTSEVQAALDLFEASIPAGRAILADGIAILEADNNGFDENGEVTDQIAARQTLRSAYPLLLSADRSSRDAQYAYRDVLIDWRVETFELTGENVSEINMERLELLYDQSVVFAESLQNRIDGAYERADAWESQIDRYEEQGHDVSLLRAELDLYRAAIPAAQESLDAANALLADAAGFDENGEVIDPIAARDSLREIYPLLQATDRGLRDAKNAYQDALFNWRVENIISDAE